MEHRTHHTGKCIKPTPGCTVLTEFPPGNVPCNCCKTGTKKGLLTASSTISAMLLVRGKGKDSDATKRREKTLWGNGLVSLAINNSFPWCQSAS